jgi:hypothetical protein
VRVRGGLIALTAALIAVLALPAAAAAKPGYFVFPGVFSLEAELGRDNGYSLSLSSVGHRRVRVVVQRPGESASYAVRARVNGRRLSANLGRFGTFHGRFEGTTHREPFFLTDCRGPKTLVGHGVLTGSFHFRGEEGYVETAAHRVKARFERFFRQVCPNAGGSGENDRVLAHEEDLGASLLEARSKAEGRELTLRAMELDWGVALLTSATAREQAGRVEIERTTQSRGKDDSLEFGPRGSYPRTVSIDPSQPFLGSATLTEEEDGTSTWVGDLRVPLIGLGTVPLTGAAFRVKTCHGSLLGVIDGCRRA